LTGYAPALTFAVRLDPASGVLAFTGHAPALSLGTLDVPNGALSLTGYAPTVTAIYVSDDHDPTREWSVPDRGTSWRVATRETAWSAPIRRTRWTVR
jgi:hypothetical protein